MKKILSHTRLLLVASVLLAACDKEDDTHPANLATGTLQVNAVQLPYFEEDGKTRATTDNSLKTTFETGDEIGIFALKNGVIQPDCKNLRLTRQADGSWGGNDVLYTNGCTYFAYSPYRNVAGINAATNTNDIYNSFTLENNQANAALFAANDLMTSTTCTVDKTNKSLTIIFEHRFALVEAEFAYCKGGGSLYPLNSLKACELHLVDEASAVVSGYNPSSTAPLKRFLLKPGANRKVAAVYEYGTNVPIAEKYPIYYKEGVTFNLAGGKRYKMKPYKTRCARVGDYYYADGTVYPLEWTEAGGTPPDVNASPACIGIVFATPNSNLGFGNTDKLNMLAVDQNRGWKNGYVLAVKKHELKIVYLGMTDYSYYSIDDYGVYYGEYDSWTAAYPYVGLTSDAKLNASNRGTLYTNTYSGYDQMQEFNANNPAISFEFIYWGNKYYVTSHKYPLHWIASHDFTEKYPLPSSTSGWFPPSIKQLTLFARNLSGEKGALFNTAQDANWSTSEEYVGTAPLMQKIRDKMQKVGGPSYSRMISCSDTVDAYPVVLNATTFGVYSGFGVATHWLDGFGDFHPMFAF